jgi:hypothetical protein
MDNLLLGRRHGHSDHKECGVAEDELPWYSEPINMWRCMETFMEVAETDDQRATLLRNTFASRLGDILLVF